MYTTNVYSKINFKQSLLIRLSLVIQPLTHNGEVRWQPDCIWVYIYYTSYIYLSMYFKVKIPNMHIERSMDQYLWNSKIYWELPQNVCIQVYIVKTYAHIHFTLIEEFNLYFGSKECICKWESDFECIPLWFHLFIQMRLTKDKLK